MGGEVGMVLAGDRMLWDGFVLLNFAAYGIEEG